MTKLSPFWSDDFLRPSHPQRLGFTDHADPRVHAAVQQLEQTHWATPILVGTTNPSTGKALFVTEQEKARYAQELHQHQRKADLTMEQCQHLLEDSLYQGIALLLAGQLDGLIAGSTRPTADVVKAALRFLPPQQGQHLLSGQFFIESPSFASADRTPFLLTDGAVVPEPSSRSLAAIAIAGASSYEFFTGKKAKVALLSFSTRGSAEHPLVDRIRDAVRIAKKQAPELVIDGDIQADAALDAQVADRKQASDSVVAGSANVLVVPTLEAGNIAYKLVQRFHSDVRVAGPILWGLQHAVSDLSRGCNVQEIVDTARCVAIMSSKGSH